MRFFYKTQDRRIRNIITNVFRSGDYMITVHYLEKINGIFQDKRLTDIINRLEKGYQEKNRGLIYVGVAAEDMLKDTKKYIAVSKIAGKISRLWQRTSAEPCEI